jgi:tRNA G18 (ribose-2'-O)-methylase SpoU
MRIETIDDPADPRVADYRDMKDSEFRLRRGLFVAESRAVVRPLLTSVRFRTRSVLLTSPALESLRGALQAADASLPVYLASYEVARTVVGFNFHHGCVALGERGAEPPLEPLLGRPGPGLIVALEDVSNPDNVGGVFRNARAFGADAILLSAGCADPLYRKAIRVSMGSSLVTPFAHLPDWAGGLARLREEPTPPPPSSECTRRRGAPASAGAKRLWLETARLADIED